jgi:hypothetical protein
LPLEPPPRDSQGQVIPHDHAGIAKNDGVIRRISEQQLVIDGASGQLRISSLALKASSTGNGGMSVDLQCSIVDAGLDPFVYVTTPRWIGSIRFSAGDLRSEGFQVGYDPLCDNPHHGEVWGEFNKTKRRRLRQICEWFVAIQNAIIGDE